MFVGTNRLSLNAATVTAAVQEYLDKRCTPAPAVTSVRVTDNGSTFEFSLGEAPKNIGGNE